MARGAPARGCGPLSDTTDTDRRAPRWTTHQVTRAVALGLLVLALVGGAVLVGTTSRSTVDDPGAYLASFYDEADVDGMLDVVPQVAFGGASRDEVREQLVQVLRQGVTVTGTGEPVDAGGVPVTRVDTEDGFVWCVGPSGTVTPSCIVAVASVDTSASADGIEVPVAEVFQQLGGPLVLSVLVENTTDQPLEIGPLQLSSTDGSQVTAQLREALVASPSQNPIPADQDTGEVPPGGLMRTIFELGLDDLGRTVRLGGESGVEITIEGLRYLHR